MTTTFSTKREILLSLTSRGYNVAHQGMTTRVSEIAGKVLGVFKGQTLTLPDITQRVAHQHPNVTPEQAKAGLLELMRLELVEQHVVVDAPRWTPATRPDNRLAPPSIAPVRAKAPTPRQKTTSSSSRNSQQTDLLRVAELSLRNARPLPTLETPGVRSVNPIQKLGTPGLMAVLSFSLMMLLGLPIWRVVFKSASPNPQTLVARDTAR
jgi:hypothetical protein